MLSAALFGSGGSRIYQRGGQHQRGGCNLLFGHIIPKTAWQWRKFVSKKRGRIQNLSMLIHHCSVIFNVRTVADPGFPGGTLSLEVDSPTYYLDQFPSKTAGKWKTWAEGEGHVSLAPTLDPPIEGPRPLTFTGILWSQKICLHWRANLLSIDRRFKGWNQVDTDQSINHQFPWRQMFFTPWFDIDVPRHRLKTFFHSYISIWNGFITAPK